MKSLYVFSVALKRTNVEAANRRFLTEFFTAWQYSSVGGFVSAVYINRNSAWRGNSLI